MDCIILRLFVFEQKALRKPNFKKQGRDNQTRWVWLAAAYCMHRERREFESYSQKCFNHHSLYVGYNVTNIS